MASRGPDIYIFQSDLNTPNNMDLNSSFITNSAALSSILSDSDPPLPLMCPFEKRLPPINDDFHQYFSDTGNTSAQIIDLDLLTNVSQKNIFDSTGSSEATMSNPRKLSKIPIPISEPNKKPKRKSMPRCVEKKLQQICSDRESNLLLIPIVTRTSSGGTTTNIMGKFL
jgi:hypothetical protein